jgi:cell division protein FtsL
MPVTPAIAMTMPTRPTAFARAGAHALADNPNKMTISAKRAITTSLAQKIASTIDEASSEEAPQMASPVLYRIFKQHGEAPRVRPVVIALVIAAICLATAGVIRVKRQHEVLRLGYELSKKSEEVRKLRETRRQLELEHATLSSPDRIRRLATQLGMTHVAPDKIRVVGKKELAQR